MTRSRQNTISEPRNQLELISTKSNSNIFNYEDALENSTQIESFLSASNLPTYEEYLEKTNNSLQLVRDDPEV